jgi:hypothetical protein
MEFKILLLGVKVIYLTDRTDLFGVGNSVLVGETSVTVLHSSQRDRECGKIIQELRQRKIVIDRQRPV